MRDEDECGDPLDELLRLSELARAIPGSRGSTTTSPSTLTRWIITGVRLPDGSRVKLRATRCGHKWLVARRWLQDFTAALTAAHLPADPPPSPRSPAARWRASEATAAELDRLGIR